jgi:hypothetical protein
MWPVWPLIRGWWLRDVDDGTNDAARTEETDVSENRGELCPSTAGVAVVADGEGTVGVTTCRAPQRNRRRFRVGRTVGSDRQSRVLEC